MIACKKYSYVRLLLAMDQKRRKGEKRENQQENVLKFNNARGEARSWGPSTPTIKRRFIRVAAVRYKGWDGICGWCRCDMCRPRIIKDKTERGDKKERQYKERGYRGKDIDKRMGTRNVSFLKGVMCMVAGTGRYPDVPARPRMRHRCIKHIGCNTFSSLSQGRWLNEGYFYTTCQRLTIA